MDGATVTINGEFWATTCVQVRAEPLLKQALYEWADWEEDRGDPYSIATGLRFLADYINGPRAPWDIREVGWTYGYEWRENPWQWATKHDDMKLSSKPSYLAMGHFLRLNPPDQSQGMESERAKYPTPLAAYLDACYAVDPAALPVDQRKPYS